MGREILIVWAGRHQRRPWEDLCADYRQRIEREAVVRDLPVKARVSGQNAARQELEGRALLDALPDPCWPVALDPRGRSRTSPQLASHLKSLRERWPHPVAFLIGSDLGLGREVLGQCREKISFGPMVLGHELARLTLYEQLYRALSLSRGINYHRSPV